MGFMPWTVIYHDAFASELEVFAETVQDALLTAVSVLVECGPMLGRPLVDTLNGSKHANMKELRFNADDGVWRVAFAFNPKRQAIVLVAGDKSGVAQGRFYKSLITRADDRYATHLETLKDN